MHLKANNKTLKTTTHAFNNKSPFFLNYFLQFFFAFSEFLLDFDQFFGLVISLDERSLKCKNLQSKAKKTSEFLLDFHQFFGLVIPLDKRSLKSKNLRSKCEKQFFLDFH